ncbi:hypothetical protein CDAR_58501 [Caerostris darwini]|uniref:Uncharacterized protein n=1 Tax=Caerostris darwini TaxID=1538125 RepID=A0AAV4U7B6_9ARAC|nr:hypothetical protein CDAR_58501 [Caerostris darwini]
MATGTGSILGDLAISRRQTLGIGIEMCKKNWGIDWREGVVKGIVYSSVSGMLGKRDLSFGLVKGGGDACWKTIRMETVAGGSELRAGHGHLEPEVLRYDARGSGRAADEDRHEAGAAPYTPQGGSRGLAQQHTG